MSELLLNTTVVEHRQRSHAVLERQADMFVSMISSVYQANDSSLNIVEPSILAIHQCLKNGWKPQILSQVILVESM